MINERTFIALLLGFVISVSFCWQQLDAQSADGLTFKEWAFKVFGAVVIGGVVARLAYLAIGYVDRRWFDGDDR
jgi:prolipoprotein diacylglyceryltransferase